MTVAPTEEMEPPVIEVQLRVLGVPATAEPASAVGHPQNEFTIELARRPVVATLRQLLVEGGAV
jgi:hypothetical protein